MGGLAARKQKNAKRQRLELHFRDQRAALKAEIRKARKDNERMLVFLLSQKLDQMPRDSSVIRIRNRCEVTGRPKSGHVGGIAPISRITARELASYGLLPGVRKV